MQPLLFMLTPGANDPDEAAQVYGSVTHVSRNVCEFEALATAGLTRPR